MKRTRPSSRASIAARSAPCSLNATSHSVGMHEAVQLDQVDLVDAHPLERAADLVVRRRVAALGRLRCQEELRPMLAEPGRETQLRLAVARGSVDVVHPVLDEQGERLVCLTLRHFPERRSSEDDARALMAGRAERCLVDHGDKSMTTPAAMGAAVGACPGTGDSPQHAPCETGEAGAITRRRRPRDPLSRDRRT